MNIKWSSSLQRFEAEFTTDFQGDYTAVKEAGFKYDGGPRVWWTQKVKVLNELRKNRPASGLTISVEALAVYTPLAEQEEKNDVVRKLLAEHKKTLKKEGNAQELLGHPTLPPGAAWIGAEHLPALPPGELRQAFVPLPPPDLLCVVCSQPVYFYELQNPPTCLWCEKISENKA